jgi:hypothetical protein
MQDANVSLNKAAEAKIKQRGDVCTRKALGFIPLPVTTFGAWETDAATNIKELAKLQASNSDRDRSKTVKHAFERLAIFLQRGNSKLLFSQSPTPNVTAQADRVY